jgi:hypothetical protein
MRLLGTFHESGDRFRNRTLGTDRPPAGRPRVLHHFGRTKPNSLMKSAEARLQETRHMDASVGRKKPRSPDLSHELEEYKRTPQKLLDALRDEAQIKRFEAGIEAEEIKDLAINVLRKAVATEAVLKELGATGRQRRRKRAGARHPRKRAGARHPPRQPSATVVCSEALARFLICTLCRRTFGRTKPNS